MSYTPRHEGARVWPSKPRLLLAALLIVGLGAAGGVLFNATDVVEPQLLAIFGYAAVLGLSYRVLDGWPRRSGQDSPPESARS